MSSVFVGDNNIPPNRNQASPLTVACSHGLLSLAFHASAIWCGIYFHYLSNGSTLKPGVLSLAHQFGGFGFWLPAVMAAVPIALLYSASVFIAARKNYSPESLGRMDKIAGFLIGSTSVIAFAAVGSFVTVHY